MLHSKKLKKVAFKKKTNKKLKVKPTKGFSLEASLQETEESKCRLKAAWADIIKRYQNISVDETDVIDLVTEEIVVDRGILQNDTIRYVGTLSLHSIRDGEKDDDTVWQPDPNLCENDDDFNQRASLRKRNNKIRDKTNDIIEILLEASNESFERLETEYNEFSCYDENLRDSDESFEELTNTEEDCNENDSSSENESLEITDEQLDSRENLSSQNVSSQNVSSQNVSSQSASSQSASSQSASSQSASSQNASSQNASSQNASSQSASSQNTESMAQLSFPRRLRVYSFNTFDSGHESEGEYTDSECSDSDNEKTCTQQENLDCTRHIDLNQRETLNYSQVTQEETLNYYQMTQQETINYYQQESLNYCQVQSIDYSQRETLEFIQKTSPIALTQEQQRLWLEPISEEYTQLSTWTGTYATGHSLLN